MEEETVQIRDVAWKLGDIREEIDWCRSRSWELETFDGVGQHMHCVICWWTIMPSCDPEIGRGYRSGPNSWLCQVCFSKFIAMT